MPISGLLSWLVAVVVFLAWANIHLDITVHCYGMWHPADGQHASHLRNDILPCHFPLKPHMITGARAEALSRLRLRDFVAFLVVFPNRVRARCAPGM